MASTYGLVLNEAAVIPLVSTLKPEDMGTVTLKNKIRVGGAGANTEYEKREATIPMCDRVNKELLLRVCKEFDNACVASRLNLTNGPKRFSKFREVLGLEYHVDWDNCADAQAVQTVDSFKEARKDFLALQFDSTDYINQKKYLNRVRKPKEMDCLSLLTRLRLINDFMQYLPDAGDKYTDQELKVIYFQMMPSDWKIKYLEAARPITDETFTIMDMARYMKVLELTRTLYEQRQQQRRGTSSNRGRGTTRRQSSSRNDRNVRARTGSRTGTRTGNRGSNQGSNSEGMCPFPGHNHKWRMCFANAQGPNYRPNYNPMGNSSGNRGTNQQNRGGRQGDAQFQEDLEQVPSAESTDPSEDFLDDTNYEDDDQHLLDQADVQDDYDDDHWLDQLQGNY